MLSQTLIAFWTIDAYVLARGHDGLWTAIALYMHENARTEFPQHHEGNGHDLQKLRP